ncbi:flagellar motor protein MotB [Sphingobium sp. AN558]|uniref:flagellar motor protein MotB n=1 Tax=Sphingobium sp. AN558 TaxID=3133442 RepID=UPI0030BE6823
MSAAPSLARRNRWSISFADLTLLLLAFFVLLQASGQRRDAMLAGLSRQFGGPAMRAGVELRAAELFTPGEAFLTIAGQQRLRQVASQFAREPGGLEVRSHGSDAAHQRFDDWDLAAARLGAVARALKADGIAGERLLIRGLDQGGERASEGQIIRIAPGRVRR